MADTHGYDMEFSKHLDMFDDSASAGGQGATDWAVPWSDLMMVMFVLFVVLYVYATTHKDVLLVFTDRTPPASAEHSSVALDGVIAGMESRFSEGLGADSSDGRPEVFYKSKLSGVSVTRQGDEVHVVLRGSDFFEQGRTELSPGGNDYLVEISEIMRMTRGDIQVVGYADTTEPDGAEGFAFSAKRASSIAAYFIDQSNVDASRFSVTGRGEYSPEVPGNAANSEDTNRRVEIIIHTGN